MNHSNIKCNDDKQCSNNYMCTFDDKNLNHQCKKGGQNNLYLGCLDHDVKSFDYVSSHNQDDLNNFDDCLSFSRKQSNKDGMMNFFEKAFCERRLVHHNTFLRFFYEYYLI